MSSIITTEHEDVIYEGGYVLFRRPNSEIAFVTRVWSSDEHYEGGANWARVVVDRGGLTRILQLAMCHERAAYAAKGSQGDLHRSQFMNPPAAVDFVTTPVDEIDANQVTGEIHPDDTVRMDSIDLTVNGWASSLLGPRTGLDPVMLDMSVTLGSTIKHASVELTTPTIEAIQLLYLSREDAWNAVVDGLTSHDVKEQVDLMWPKADAP